MKNLMQNEIGKVYSVGEKDCDFDTQEEAYDQIHVEKGYMLAEVDVDEETDGVCIENIFYEQHVAKDGESIELGEAECTEVVAKYVICEDYTGNDREDINPEKIYAHSSGEPDALADIYSGATILELGDDEIDWRYDYVAEVFTGE